MLLPRACGGGGPPQAGRRGRLRRSTMPDMSPDPKAYRQCTGSSPHASVRAKQLRRELTPPERLLWSGLRAKRLGGLKFRKQHGLGAYVADFYCHAARLVVEIDGDHHHGDGQHDRRRDDWMHAQGIRVVRVEAREVMRNLEGVRRAIERVGLERVAAREAERGKLAQA